MCYQNVAWFLPLIFFPLNVYYCTVILLIIYSFWLTSYLLCVQLVKMCLLNFIVAFVGKACIKKVLLSNCLQELMELHQVDHALICIFSRLVLSKTELTFSVNLWF